MRLTLVAAGAVLSMIGVGLIVLLLMDILIVRDAETRRHIKETANVELPLNADGELSFVVTKSRRRLDILMDGKRIKTYPVALGGSPRGDKRVQGDKKTPLGEFLLIPHHPSPNWGKSFYVGYPNEEHAQRGLAKGLIRAEDHEEILRTLARREDPPPAGTKLGGRILIHTKWGRTPFLTRFNWTQGCIVMSNDDLNELLAVFAKADRPTVVINEG